MFGTPDHCLGASLTRHFSAEVNDQAHALLQFPGGVVGQLSVDWSDPSVRKMTTKISVWGDAGKLYVDRTELQLFLTGKHAMPGGYREGWTVKHITDLTEPVSFYTMLGVSEALSHTKAIICVILPNLERHSLKNRLPL
jgi:predicted dehydrogenase